MSDEWGLAGLGDGANRRLADRLGDPVEAGGGDLQDPGAAEPCRGRSDVAADRGPDPGCRTPERVDEVREKVVLYFAEKAQGDVPLPWMHRSQPWHRSQIQRREPAHRKVVGPYGDEYPHTKSVPDDQRGVRIALTGSSGCPSGRDADGDDLLTLGGGSLNVVPTRQSTGTGRAGAAVPEGGVLG